MTTRLEILFSGEAPDDEFERAQKLGDAGVLTAMEELLHVLDNVGLKLKREVRAVRVTPKRGGTKKPVERKEAA